MKFFLAGILFGISLSINAAAPPPSDQEISDHCVDYVNGTIGAIFRDAAYNGTTKEQIYEFFLSQKDEGNTAELLALTDAVFLADVEKLAPAAAALHAKCFEFNRKAFATKI